MLSIVPLMQGGGCLGGTNTLNNSIHEGYLRWDSLGVLSFGSFIRTFRSVYNNPKALVLAEALDQF
jgi:monomeric isocitrate dehydrogenase